MPYKQIQDCFALHHTGSAKFSSLKNICLCPKFKVNTSRCSTFWQTWPRPGVHLQLGVTQRSVTLFGLALWSQVGLTSDIYGSILIPTPHWSARSVAPPILLATAPPWLRSTRMMTRTSSVRRLWWNGAQVTQPTEKFHFITSRQSLKHCNSKDMYSSPLTRETHTGPLNFGIQTITVDLKRTHEPNE